MAQQNPFSDWSQEEIESLREIVNAHEQPDGVSRRDALKAMGLLGTGALIGGGGATQLIEEASAASNQVGQIGDPSNLVDVYAEDIDAVSVGADEATINNSLTWPDGTTTTTSPGSGGDGSFRPTNYPFTPNYQLDKTKLDDDTLGEEGEPRGVVLNDGTLFMVYRTGSDHVSNDGKLVSVESTDGGRTWTSPSTVVDDASVDDRNHVVGYYPPDNRLIVIYATYDNAAGAFQGVHYVTSTDSGSTWSSRTDITEFTNAKQPFGQIVHTSNGLFATAYTADYVEGIFSTDGGQTWGSMVTVADSSADTGVEVTEPSCARKSNSELLIYGRDNDTTNGYGYYTLTSSDGGQTWTGYSTVNPFGSKTVADPASARFIGEHLVVAYINRETDELTFTATPKEWAFDNYDQLGGESPVLVDTTVTGANSNDNGYPYLIPIDPSSTNHMLVAYYEASSSGASTTDCVIRSMPALPDTWLRTADPTGARVGQDYYRTDLD